MKIGRKFIRKFVLCFHKNLIFKIKWKSQHIPFQFRINEMANCEDVHIPFVIYLMNEKRK